MYSQIRQIEMTLNILKKNVKNATPAEKVLKKIENLEKTLKLLKDASDK